MLDESEKNSATLQRQGSLRRGRNILVADDAQNEREKKTCC